MRVPVAGPMALDDRARVLSARLKAVDVLPDVVEHGSHARGTR
jgi:hypothetical protein